MRAVLLAATAAVVLAVAPAATASGSPQSPWVAYLAPPSACPGAERLHASPALQRHAMTCLINWTRGRVGVRRLAWSSKLAAAADVKAAIVAECGDFSHYPCGTRWPAVSSRDKRYDIWGENLYFGSSWLRSPRAAMLGWLESPEHRAILFGRSWRDVGVAVLPGRFLDGPAAGSLWVLEVAGHV